MAREAPAEIGLNGPQVRAERTKSRGLGLELPVVVR